MMTGGDEGRKETRWMLFLKKIIPAAAMIRENLLSRE
jgi:hypothetical protein